MTLIQFTSTERNGPPLWVNPEAVSFVKPEMGGANTVIWLIGEETGVMVRESIDEVIKMLTLGDYISSAYFEKEKGE